MKVGFDKEYIHKLLNELNTKLAKENAKGEIFLVGGAVMCLVLNALAAIANLDTYFSSTTIIRQAAFKVANRLEVPNNWLNDCVKTYLNIHGDFSVYLELSNLQVLAAAPEYLLAMKCLSARTGPEFHDIEDIRFLLRMLNIETLIEAQKMIGQYYSLDKLPPRALYVLEELLQN